jgi:uncharacterized membrane protein YobD (UPF0266 family)
MHLMVVATVGLGMEAAQTPPLGEALKFLFMYLQDFSSERILYKCSSTVFFYKLLFFKYF